MDKITLKAEERKIFGHKVRILRKQKLLPANIFGKKIKSLAIQVDEAEFEKVFKTAGETGLVSLSVGKEERPVLIYNLQTDPVSDKPIHVDFLQVDLKEKVTANVPVELVGESPAEKQGLGTVVLLLNEVEVEALPTELPEKFEVDVAILTEVDQAVFIKDLKIDKSKIEIKEEPDTMIVKVEPPQVEKVEEVPAAPVEGEEPTEEGVIPSEEGVAESTEQPQEEEKKKE